jgi:hypothetical protein
MINFAWTPEMDSALVELRGKGVGYNECGVKIGVANNAVIRRVARLKLPTWGPGGGRRGTVRRAE